jgi:outer membrane protein
MEHFKTEYRVSNAFCKLWEIYNAFDVLPLKANPKMFLMAEAPGQWIHCSYYYYFLNYAKKHNTPKMKYEIDWRANSLNPFNQVNIAKANLLSTMAHSPGEKAEFAENSFPTEITESEISNFRSKFSSVDEAYAQALANRPDFAAAKSRIEASKFSIIASKSGYYPSISATGGWSWANSEIKDFDLFGRSFVALNVDIPLFDAFRTNQQIQNAELQSKQNELEKERTQQTIRIQLQSGLLNVYSAEKQLEITNRSIVAANQNFESAKERFEVGTATIVDYLTANTQLITAKINRVNAVYNYFDAQVQVKFALGSM